MKKLTHLLTICALVMITSNGIAQDVGVTDIPNFDPITPTTVYSNIPNFVEYTRENLGSVSITSSMVDSFTMELFVDQIKRQTFYRDMRAPFATGASETRNGVAPMDWGSLGLSMGQNAVCVRTRLWKSGSLIDVTPSNDEYCLVVNYAGDNNPLQWDLAILNVTVEDGLGNIITDGGLVTDDGGVAFVRFDMYNNGITDLPAGVPLLFELSFNGAPQTPNFTYTLTQPMGAMGTIPGLGLELGPASIFLPASGGNDLKICVKMISNPDDTDNSNDEGCSTFNSTLSVEDVTTIEDNIEIKYFNRNLNIVLTNEMTGVLTVDIISVSGQEVLNTALNTNVNNNYNIDLDKLNNGVYIVNIKTEDNQVKSQRFIVE